MTHNVVRAVGGLGLGVLVASACTPTVKLEAPREPITINLNIKLDANFAQIYFPPLSPL